MTDRVATPDETLGFWERQASRGYFRGEPVGVAEAYRLVGLEVTRHPDLAKVRVGDDPATPVPASLHRGVAVFGASDDRTGRRLEDPDEASLGRLHDPEGAGDLVSGHVVDVHGPSEARRALAIDALLGDLRETLLQLAPIAGELLSRVEETFRRELALVVRAHAIDLAMEEKYRAGETLEQIAAQFGVSRQRVHQRIERAMGPQPGEQLGRGRGSRPS